MEETSDTVQSFSSSSQRNPALSVVFYSHMQVICHPRTKKKKKLMVSVHSLDATLKINKGAMLPPALTREGSDEAGRTGCSFWVNWCRVGVRVVGPGMLCLWGYGVFLARRPGTSSVPSARRGAAGARRICSAALSRQSDFTKKGTWSTWARRGLQRLCRLCLHLWCPGGGGGGSRRKMATGALLWLSSSRRAWELLQAALGVSGSPQQGLEKQTWG